MSRDTVACTASMPTSRSASATSLCVASSALLDEAQDHALPLELRRHLRGSLPEDRDRLIGLVGP